MSDPLPEHVQAVAEALDGWAQAQPKTEDGGLGAKVNALISESDRSAIAHELLITDDPAVLDAFQGALVRRGRLTVESRWALRMLPEFAAHKHPAAAGDYWHTCPACNPLPSERERYFATRFVSEWQEVERCDD